MVSSATMTPLPTVSLPELSVIHIQTIDCGGGGGGDDDDAAPRRHPSHYHH